MSNEEISSADITRIETLKLTAGELSDHLKADRAVTDQKAARVRINAFFAAVADAKDLILSRVHREVLFAAALERAARAADAIRKVVARGDWQDLPDWIPELNSVVYFANIDLAQFQSQIPDPLAFLAEVTKPRNGHMPPAPSVEFANEPASDEPLLSPIEAAILCFLLDQQILRPEQRLTAEQIAAGIAGVYPQTSSVSAAITRLTSAGLLESKTGRGGGSWLAEKGQSRAEAIRRNSSKLPETSRNSQY